MPSPELPLLLGSGVEETEMLLLLGAPDDDGVVEVRTWSSENWGSPPRSRAERADALLAWLESQAAAGRAMNQSLYTVRLWLRGQGNRAGPT